MILFRFEIGGVCFRVLTVVILLSLPLVGSTLLNEQWNGCFARVQRTVFFSLLLSHLFYLTLFISIKEKKKLKKENESADNAHELLHCLRSQFYRRPFHGKPLG